MNIGKKWFSQGFVLGPLLFNVFINNLELGVSSEVVKFTNDVNLW